MIVDDHALFRAALRKLLEREPHLDVVGEASSGKDAIAQMEKLQPDVLLLDLTMPHVSGWDVLRKLSKMSSKVRTILLSEAIEREQIVEALCLGARGILLKSTASQLLYKSIRTVMAGEYWVHRSIICELVDNLRTSGQPGAKPATNDNYRLTRRELDILTSVVDGCTNRDIAAKFKISEQTVKHHLTNIFEKVGVSNRLELALFAMNQRLAS
jgi:DNA-binding NarL/FixJ family response regulator